MPSRDMHAYACGGTNKHSLTSNCGSDAAPAWEGVSDREGGREEQERLLPLPCSSSSTSVRRWWRIL